MPSLKLTNLQSFKAYFNAIADAHVSIDGFKWGEKKVIQSGNRSDITKSYLWAQRYNKVRYTDNGSDNAMKKKVARLSYMKVRESERFADEDDDFQFCESVIDDIIAKIMMDKRGSMIGDDWVMIVANIPSINTYPIQDLIGGTVYIGWALELEILDNTNLVYDQTKWIS
jgi:hypothetical protein